MINNWSYFENGFLLAQKLKREGKILLGLEFCSGSKLITDIKKTDRIKSIVLIVGNELMGIDPEIRKICDELVYIPMMGKKSSFNVTIAFGIAAFYLNYICS